MLSNISSHYFKTISGGGGGDLPSIECIPGSQHRQELFKNSSALFFSLGEALTYLQEEEFFLLLLKNLMLLLLS